MGVPVTSEARKARSKPEASTSNAPQVSSNWKALRKTMPIPVAAQEISSANRKRKRETSPAEKLDVAKVMNGAAITDSKGKGKAKDESILGDDGLTGRKAEAGLYVSLDCEFVGVYDPASNHSEHSLARVSIVNLYGVTVLDTFVAQRERIGDWRTWVSGVRPQDVKDAPTFKEVQQKVADILKDRILVGHAVYNDLKVLLLKHPHDKIRDTSTYGPLRELAGSKRPALRTLAKKALGIDIQDGEHSSVTDARATMAVYRTVQKEWEAKLRGAGTKKPKKVKVAVDITLDTVNGGTKSAPRAKNGKAGSSKGSLSLSQTISRETNWWSSSTIDR